MSTFPDYRGAIILWGFFGVSTILLFWAALIRACRDWGGHNQQGRAYGLLDAGRGLLAAILASLGVMLFSLSFPEGYSAASEADKAEALRSIILAYAGITAAAGVLVWFVITDGHPLEEPELDEWKPETESTLQHVLRVLSIPAVWLQALIILCAYVSYKGFDNYTLFAVQAYGLDEVEAARIAAVGAWVRPFAAIAAGLVGDRLSPSRTIAYLFALLMAAHLFFALTTPIPGASWVILTNILITCIAIYGFRGLYFALFEEAKVPAAVTGTAVGFVSVIGYTPDIFVTLVAGILIDRNPGLLGHQHFYIFLAISALIGLIASLALARKVRIQPDTP